MDEFYHSLATLVGVLVAELLFCTYKIIMEKKCD